MRLFHVKILYANNWSQSLRLWLKHNKCLDSTFSFQFDHISILFTVQASNNAANWKSTTKVNWISYWLSLANIKTNDPFFIDFWMQLPYHKSSFRDTYRFRQVITFGFCIADIDNQSRIGRFWCKRKTKM